MTVLDTHAWIWWVSDTTRLGKKARQRIDAAQRIGVAAVSCFEVAAAVAKGRISLDRSPLDWLQQALALPRVELLPLTPAVAVKATQLGSFHGDPADRLIVATTILESGTLVTRDRRLRNYAPLETIW
ncbi:MAG: type II toxin-antitoxin system VapC family toxin [Acidobacteria bacterium]|nr:type II toxin-antitoxin system VapC family toxin [Acidobacteriota bacterium]